MSIDSSMGSRRCAGLDDLLLSPLPFTCASLASAIWMLHLTTCVLSIDFSMGSRVSGGLDASQRLTFTFTCTSFSHAFYLFLSLADLRATNLTVKSSVLRALLGLLGASIASIYFAAKLWHHSLALVGRCCYTLCPIDLLDLYHSFLLSDSLCVSRVALLALFSGVTSLPLQ